MHGSAVQRGARGTVAHSTEKPEAASRHLKTLGYTIFSPNLCRIPQIPLFGNPCMHYNITTTAQLYVISYHFSIFSLDGFAECFLTKSIYRTRAIINLS